MSQRTIPSVRRAPTANPSKGHAAATSTAAAAPRGRPVTASRDKENIGAQQAPSQDALPRGRTHEDQEDDRDPTYNGSLAAREDDEDEDEDRPTHGRKRRMSEKMLLLVKESEATEARKKTKADKVAKAAKKQELQAAGLDYDEDSDPRRDDVFTSRPVPTRPATTKILTQRNNKVPPTPTFSDSRRHPSSHARVASSSAHHQEDRYEHRDLRDGHHALADDDQRRHLHSRSRSPLYSRGGSPARPRRSPSPPPVRNTDGGLIPDHPQLDIRTQVSRGVSSPIPKSRSPSLSAGDKRPRSPSDDLRVAQAQKTGTTTGRPKAADFDDVTREVIALAIAIYRCYLSVVHAFPDHAMEQDFLHKAWAEACRQLKIVMDITPTISKLITSRGSHLRGELKTKMRALVELMYGFSSGENKKTIARNRKLAEELKENLTFTFKDIEARKGIYRHPIFQKAVNAMWFANRRDEGPTYPEFFSPFPVEGLTFVCTVAVNLIDEWATGIRTDIPFTANEYRETYETHLAAIEEFEKSTGHYKILEIILTRLHNIGRSNSGAQPLAVVKKSILSKTDLAAAIKEYQEDSNTETDGEDGEHE
ncbi:hypothetical protein B0H15DRAFT_165265 [Mycena belliarum]|uniref:DUF6532 domain-containing protein n=1 Tax=Mycena belliarum TaxID=1033014 RepID=A0AAD6UC66_9AGAR|nr:hypothetical protein B0H15DRAFT_165265 [Mycena belliae]